LTTLNLTPRKERSNRFNFYYNIILFIILNFICRRGFALWSKHSYSYCTYSHYCMFCTFSFN